ncbi:Hypothetical predicted protein [Octopus vulgaris]|uniref:Uncharacterized protein n=1 Tax=Octopus vulgaris TaxID=6645 RepID=A0AA36AR40_OCTVU|nr:Hypothetical predicted protein [Octopus vulgaris]
MTSPKPFTGLGQRETIPQFITLIATKDLNDEDDPYIRYRIDGSKFNLRWLLFHIKGLEKLLREVFFANCALLVALAQSVLQLIMYNRI